MEGNIWRKMPLVLCLFVLVLVNLLVKHATEYTNNNEQRSKMKDWKRPLVKIGDIFIILTLYLAQILSIILKKFTIWATDLCWCIRIVEIDIKKKCKFKSFTIPIRKCLVLRLFSIYFLNVVKIMSENTQHSKKGICILSTGNEF